MLDGLGNDQLCCRAVIHNRLLAFPLRPFGADIISIGIDLINTSLLRDPMGSVSFLRRRTHIRVAPLFRIGVVGLRGPISCLAMVSG